MRIPAALRHVLGYGPFVRTPEEITAILERELAGEIDRSEWDEFQSLQISDPSLNALRESIPLAGRHTAEGRAAIATALEQLRRGPARQPNGY